MEEEFQGAATRDVRTETHGGPTEPVSQTQKTPSPSPAFIKENIDVLRTMIKEHDQQAKMKATPRKFAYTDSDKETPALSLTKGFSDRLSLESSGTSDTYRQTRSASKSQRTPSRTKEPTHLRTSRRLEDRSITKEKVKKERSKSRRKRSGHQEASSDSKYEEGSEDAYEDLNSPYKRPKPTPFTQKITRFKYHRTVKLPRNIRVYEGNKDLEDHFGIFSVAANVDSFEELSQKFLEEFSQQKRYAKDPTEIHGINRRQNEGLQAFMDRFKSESSHIKGVPLVLRISAYMHGHGHPELAKKLNDKIPKTVDEMFERVSAFIRGEVAAGSVEMVRPSQGDKGSLEIMYEHCFRNLDINIQSRLRRCKASMIGFSGEMYQPLGLIRLRVTIGKQGRSKTVLMEFEIIKCYSPYNIIIGSIGITSLEAMGSTIHSMIKFPTDQGVVTMETSRETLRECKHLERVQGSWKEM
ncbi:hypothetical protein Tco_0033298 [Tanacetum coccineum]